MDCDKVVGFAGFAFLKEGTIFFRKETLLYSFVCFANPMTICMLQCHTMHKLYLNIAVLPSSSLLLSFHTPASFRSFLSRLSLIPSVISSRTPFALVLSDAPCKVAAGYLLR